MLSIIMQHAPEPMSTSESSFIVNALSKGMRVDGRRPLESRPLSVSLGAESGSVQVKLGGTQVLAVATADLIEPYADRPAEGVLQFFVELSSMASPAFEPGRPPEAAVLMMRQLDRAIRKSQAVDVEALCVVAGKHVWSVRCDVTVLDDRGSLADAAHFAALVALRHMRLPPVSVSGVGDQASASVLPVEQGETTELVFHHMPMAVTVGLCRLPDADELLCVVDPTDREELVMQGSLGVVVNQHQELCTLHKPGGMPVEPARLLECMRSAVEVAPQRLVTLEAVLHEHAQQLAVAAETLRRTGRRAKRTLANAAQTIAPAVSLDGQGKREAPMESAGSPMCDVAEPSVPPELPTAAAPAAPASKKKKKKKRKAQQALGELSDADEETTVMVRSEFDTGLQPSS